MLMLFLALAVGQPDTLYDRATAEALRQQSPLVLFVGERGKLLPSVEWKAVYANLDSLDGGYPDKCVVVMLPTKDAMAWKATLPAGASEADIRKTIERFQKSYVDKSKRQTREDEIIAQAPAVIFVRTPAYKMKYVQPWNADTWAGDDTPRIVIVVSKDNQRSFVPDSTEEGLMVRLREMQRGTVAAQQPVPFSDSKPAPVRRDDSPWLPVGEHDKLKELWPEGVPFPDTLKFYRLPKASQRIATTNNSPSRGFHLARFGEDNINVEYPYVGSGGLDWSDKKTWRNVTGLAIPDGKRINVWTERVPILNSFGSYQMEEKLLWKFPPGTQAYDVLLRKNDDGSEHIFTVRVREKDDNGKWDDGTSYFPDVPVDDYKTTKSAGTSRTRNVLGAQELTFKTGLVGRILGKPRFKATPPTVALNDGGHYFPPNFGGTGMSCTRCHTAMQKEDSPYAGPSLRGGDTVYSWYPASVNAVDRDYYTPEIDARWPIKYGKY